MVSIVERYRGAARAGRVGRMLPVTTIGSFGR
jgi:hypothetical protein